MVQEEILVSIRCTVYNHAPYLRRCLDGFVMQKTNFRFEAFVHDDASTDESTSIIQEYAEKYPDIIKPYLEKENIYSKNDGRFRSITYSPSLLRGKYVAICEGDDYWTDPFKLQKQFDYMEAHTDCTLCFHNALTHWYDSDRPDEIFAQIEDRDYTGLELNTRWYAPTASFFFRASLLEGFVKLLEGRKFLIQGDIPLVTYCANNGTIHGLSDIMCVYGKHANGWTHFDDAAKSFAAGRSWEECRGFFGKEYVGITSTLMTGYYMAAIGRALKEKNWKVLFKACYRGILRQPITGIRALMRIPAERKARLNAG